MSKKRIEPLSLNETLVLDSKATEIFNQVYADFEKEISKKFKARLKNELKELLPIGSKIRTSKIQSPEVKGDFKSKNVYKGTYQRSMFTIHVPTN